MMGKIILLEENYTEAKRVRTVEAKCELRKRGQVLLMRENQSGGKWKMQSQNVECKEETIENEGETERVTKEQQEGVTGVRWRLSDKVFELDKF